MGALKLVTPPAGEPVSTDELKAHLRVEHSSDNSLIDGLNKAARLQLEEITNRAFMQQTLLHVLPDWPAAGRIKLPRSPLISVSSVKYYDTAGVLQTLSAAAYVVDAVNEPGQVFPAYGYVWPTVQADRPDAVQIEYLAGFPTAAEVPENIKHAVKFLAAHWYENRETVNIGNISPELPFTLQALIASIRVYRI